jgi:transposase InsO family protein
MFIYTNENSSKTSFRKKRMCQKKEHGLELVHGDLCGPIAPATPSGNSYFLLLDDHSRYMWISTLVSKNQVDVAIMEFQARAEGESGHKLWMLCTDRGGEFTSKQFTEYCVQEGVKRQLMAPYSPQQNGVVERRNAMVVGAARSMLKQKGLPDWFGGGQ